MMVAKILAVLAAAFMVGAVAVGTLGPPDMTLGEALAAMDHIRLTAVEAYVRTHMAAWIWEHPVTSLLLRPVWLVPAAVSLVMAGSAMTVASAHKAPNSRRRRS